MIKYYLQLRQILRLGREASRYLHPTAHVCRHSRLHFPCYLGKGTRIKNTTVGAYAYVSTHTQAIDCDIGAYASIGPECLIGGLGRHPTDHFSTSPLTYSTVNPLSRLLGSTGFDLRFPESARVTIGPDVWIGARAIIADGVTISAGAIIGANTFVGKDVPPYAVFYGSPPRIHRHRFDPATISRLLETKWWTSPPGEIDNQLLQKILHDPTDNR
jgi:acetyltransferase-like isoleucine patch superfamily enzyme